MTSAEKLNQGKRAIMVMLDYWKNRCDVTLGQLHAIANWGLGEQASLDPSFVSRAIKGERGVTIANLIAFDALNHSLWTWQMEGRESALAQFGPLEVWTVEETWLDRSIWLPHPDPDKERLELADFLHVLVGRLPLPYLGGQLLVPSDLKATNDKLSLLLNNLVADLTPRDGIRKLLKAYPVSDESRRNRFRAVILGEVLLTREQLNEELQAISDVIRVLRGQPKSSYGAEQLARELEACEDNHAEQIKAPNRCG